MDLLSIVSPYFVLLPWQYVWNILYQKMFCVVWALRGGHISVPVAL